MNVCCDRMAAVSAEGRFTIEAACDRLAVFSHDDRLNVSAVYDFFKPKGPKAAWAGIVWNASVALKHAFIIWLGANKCKLLIKDKMKFLDIDRTCIFCGLVEEMEHHIFFSCPLSYSVWEKIRSWLGLKRSMSTLPSVLKWIKKEAWGTFWQSKVKRIALTSTVYRLWTTRNRRIF